MLLISGRNTDYRIKLTGFHEELTAAYLSQLLDLQKSNLYVDEKQNRVGYFGKIKTMKFAKKLMMRWHDKEFDGQTLKCQLEISPFSPRRNSNRSRGGRGDKGSKYSGSGTGSVRSIQEKSNCGDYDDDDEPPVFDDREVGRDGRLFGSAMRSMTSSPRKSSLRRASSSETIQNSVEPKCKRLGMRRTHGTVLFLDRLPGDVPADEWEITNRAKESTEKVLLIRGSIDRQRLAVIKVYKDHSSRDYRRELTALQDLKGKNNPEVDRFNGIPLRRRYQGSGSIDRT